MRIPHLNILLRHYVILWKNILRMCMFLTFVYVPRVCVHVPGTFCERESVVCMNRWSQVPIPLHLMKTKVGSIVYLILMT